MSELGKYIVIEGIDASGKSTQAERLRRTLGKRGVKASGFDEPGGTDFSNAVRQIIQNGTLERSSRANLLLFTAAREDNWRKIGSAALQNDEFIVTARNWYSTLVYQGYGEGLPLEVITSTTKEHMPPRYLKPDMTILLTIQDEVERERRIIERGELEHPDTFESKDAQFQQKLHFGYTQLAQRHEVTVVDASGSMDEVEEKIFEKIKPLLGKHAASN